jgi:uncharacterized protein YbjT (DUF2867 family)
MLAAQSSSVAFARPGVSRASTSTTTRRPVVVARASSASASDFSRRSVLLTPALVSLLGLPNAANARDGPSVLVVGSTGATGRLVVEELAKSGKTGRLVAGARSAEKAESLGLGTSADVLGGVDVTKTPNELAETFKGFDIIVVATGFVPGNPFKMNEAAHAVDNLGAQHVADAAKIAGVKRVVLISSILTNGPGMGAQDTPGYKITNAFGRVLEEKLVGENYLRSSGVPWTIVRPAGLKNDEPRAPLVLTDGDVMTSGEISRALVAKVMAYAAFDPSCEGRIIEIAESGSFTGGDPAAGKKFSLDSDPANWFA